jgi:hypothetical protein
MHNQSQEISSFLMHRLQSSNHELSGMGGNAASVDDRVINELQKFLELERLKRHPQDGAVAPVTKLLPQSGRFLRSL